jgi:TolB-like protein/tetratricopeptide (TPR) repeat protein
VEAEMLYIFDSYALDTDRRELRREGELVPVEPQVFDLLVYLIHNRERVVSKDDLLAAIWGGRIVSESVLDTRIGAARSAIGDTGKEQRLIKTLPRKGIRFVGAVREDLKPPGSDDIVSAQPRRERALPDKPSIAVLPFTNMSGDPQQDYFADGMAEDITTALSKVRWFFVVSRNSAFTYKGKAVDVRQAARELDARYVLEGSVRKSGNRMRITAQLLDAATSHHVWAERYDREVIDIFAVQDEITEQVVAAIEPQLYAAEGIRAKRKPPESLDAWECVVRALSLMNSRARPDVTAARTLLQKAVALDPGYGQAYSLLSFVTTLGMHLGWDSREGALKFASEAAHKALQLDADDAWAHVALGYMLAWSRRAGDAVAEYEKALALNPNLAIAHWLLALALCYLARTEEAMAHGDEAARLSPRDLLARGNVGVSNNVRGLACFIAGHYREGMQFARKAIIESPNLIPAYRVLILNCAHAGELEEARAALQTLKGLAPDISLKSIKEMRIPYVRTEDQERYLEGFRLAGLE